MGRSNMSEGREQRDGRSFEDGGDQRFGSFDGDAYGREQRSFDDRRGYDDRDFPRRASNDRWDADRFADDGGYEGSFERSFQPSYNPYDREDPRAMGGLRGGQQPQRAWRDSASQRMQGRSREDTNVGWSPYDPDYNLRSNDRSRFDGRDSSWDRSDRGWGTSPSTQSYRARQGGFGGMQGMQGRQQGDRMGQSANMGPLGERWGNDQRWGMEPGEQIGTRRMGKGVKGYKRSDERIREDVCDRISDLDVDASDVEVSVKDGEVTLTGTIPERHMKYAIEQCCERVSGVNECNNQLRMKRDQQQSSSSSMSSSSSSLSSSDRSKNDDEGGTGRLGSSSSSMTDKSKNAKQ